MAQFGSGVIAQVSNRILKQFANRLNEAIAGPHERPDSSVRVAPRTPAQTDLLRADERLALAVTALAGVALGLAIGRTVGALR